MKTVSLADAKRNLFGVLREVAIGQDVMILSRGKPVATISPVSLKSNQRQAAKLSLLGRLNKQPASVQRDWSRDELYGLDHACQLVDPEQPLSTRPMCNRNSSQVQMQRGFTLVELVMVIVIMGVIGGVVSVFMKSPIDAYFASARRAALTDTADTVVRRMARDIQRALPHSIRPCPAGTIGLEFIPTKTGARYRAVGAGALDFTTTASSFNMLASKTDFAGVANAIPVEQRIATDDLIVIYNLGIPGSDAYSSSSKNWSEVTLVDATTAEETPIHINPFKFPLESGSNRFQVVSSTEKLVSYVCDGSILHRTVSGSATVNPYSSTASCPATGPAVATNVDCTGTITSSWFKYSGSDLMRNALVSMKLTVTAGGESVSLQHEVHVSNTP